MNLLVCVKETIDLDQLKFSSSGKPELVGIPLEIEEMSKHAVEAAVKLKELYGGKVMVISAGRGTLKKTIKEVLAMGADEALLINTGDAKYDDAAIAWMLAEEIKKLVQKPDIVLLGEGSSDNYSGQIGPRLAEMLKYPLITFTRNIEFRNGTVECMRDLEDCYEIVSAATPVVITVTAEINEPRLPALSDILKAGRKPIHEINAAELKPPAVVVQRLRNLAPEIARKNVIFEGEEGVQKLAAEIRKLTRRS